ncbi:hypothetical protein [Candidatus Oleimmundimicrobium sp.]|uniref:hypothetical protein n=1 Tax=Candidatus Oleimmundimicrobium sp. TaxID=3060597 RepID=UPI0027238276|nr:hypothetical protein [Candidatus Oleimmundimicrobium sp.]MDO8886121.1 hypothetical protein [Candidatus Oleimmundimicrobium sp.]
MKIQKIYELAIKEGMKADPRDKEELDKFLEKSKKEYENLKDDEKEFFDLEKLTNPYSDTRILAGDPNTDVSTILCGVDIEVGEVLLADRLREKGKNIDLLLAHHPEGKSLAGLPGVMRVQADIWHREGVPINIGEFLIDERMKEVQRSVMPVNHNRAVDAAKLLGIPFMNVHTPADNMVTSFLQKGFDEVPPYTVKDVISFLRKIPEYNMAAKTGTGPTILVGDGDKRAGRVVVDMTGGTEGPEEVLEKLANAGVGTIVGMHMGSKLRKKALKYHINVVIAGHIASDNLGLNLLLDNLEKEGIEIIECSGFTRISRL